MAELREVRDRLQRRLLALAAVVPVELLGVLFGEEPGLAALSEERSSVEVVGSHWGAVAEARVAAPVAGWLDSRIVLREYVQPLASGTRDGFWLAALARDLGIPPGGHWLSLGCGSAGTEIQGARDGLFGSMVAMDASEGALNVARSASRDLGVTCIDFRTVDFDRLRLAPESFDAVMMCMSLHHVKKLESTLAEIGAALRPGGFLLLNEYVGPNQFQFGERQLALVREMLASIPRNLRLDSTTGRPKSEYPMRSVESWNVVDPSEAIRSSEIVEQVGRAFEIAVRRDYGGTLLHLVLEHISHNFREDEPSHVEEIRRLAAREDELIRTGILTSDFAVIGAVKRSGP